MSAVLKRVRWVGCSRHRFVVSGALEGRVSMAGQLSVARLGPGFERPSPAAHRCQHGVNTDVMKALAQAFDR